MSKTEQYPLHGGQLRQIAERFNIAASSLLDFSANINPDGPSPTVVAALREGLDDLSLITHYPDLEQIELRTAIAAHIGVDIHSIIVANGFAPLLEATLRGIKIRSCCLPVPAFVEYRKTLERAEIKIVPLTLNANTGFHYDDAAILSGSHDAILLANPQNPSGICHDFSRMKELVAKAAKKKTYVLLDEAFIDYAPQHSLTAATEEFPNLIAFRSVTKFHAIPGLRVSYAVANPLLSLSISHNLPPWPITTLAARGALTALADDTYADRTITANWDRRSSLQNDLKLLGLTVYPSAANFILFRLPSGIDPDYFWRQMILDHHIVLRACANYEGLAPGYFRVAVKTKEENKKLIESLKQLLFSQEGSNPVDARDAQRKSVTTEDGHAFNHSKLHFQ